MNVNPHNPQNFPLIPLNHFPTLEAQFIKQITSEEYFQQARKIIEFGRFLEPNEPCVSKNKQNLHLSKPGFLVTVGTERSFFDLILCAEASRENCLGLIIQDIDPHVKAYTDFVTLLLRLANNHEEFKQFTDLSLFSENGEFSIHESKKYHSVLRCIEHKLQGASISQSIKTYYQNNLEKFAKIYYTTRQEWRRHNTLWQDRGSFPNYYENPKYFDLLHQYASQGKIITTVGDIGDLSLFSDLPIGVIDVSNVPDYTFIRFTENIKKANPPIISTTFLGKSFGENYSCTRWKYLNEKEETDFKELLKTASKILDFYNQDSLDPINLKQICEDKTIGFNKPSLDCLRDCVNYPKSTKSPNNLSPQRGFSQDFPPSAIPFEVAIKKISYLVDNVI